MSCRATALALALSTMPFQSRCPLFDESESTRRPSASRAMAKYSPSSTQKSRFNRRFRSEARPPAASAQPGAGDLGVVGVALEPAGGPGKAREPAVVVGDGVPGVLPALVLKPGLLV